MAIQIISDSTCDLTEEQRNELGIAIVPLKVRFGDREYTECVDITLDEFYKKLATSPQLPTTSQPSPEDFERVIRPCLDKGDEVVVLTLSAAISGTYQSASIAQKNLRSDKVHVIDTASATLGLGDLVKKAVALSGAGVTAKQIVETITDYASRLRIVAVIDTLKYLHKGGRLSALSTVLGGMLNIKPIVSLVDGKVELIGRARGLNAAYEWVFNKFMDSNVDLSLGCLFGFSQNPDYMNQLIALFKERVSLPDYYIGEIGTVIGTHAGPNVAAFCYYEAR